MIRIQSEIKRAMLRQICEGAKATSSTVKQALIATQAAAADNSFKKGRIITSTSGNGQSASFAFFSPTGASGFTQDNVVGLTEEFVNILDDAVAGGIIDDPNTVDATFAAMVTDDRLVGIRQQMGDFTSLRFPVTR